MQPRRSLLGLSGKSLDASMARTHPSELTSGISAIFDDTKPQAREPIVQCVQVKPLPPQPNHPERYRAVFSDIANYVQTMLATRKSSQVHLVLEFGT